MVQGAAIRIERRTAGDAAAAAVPSRETRWRLPNRHKLPPVDRDRQGFTCSRRPTLWAFVFVTRFVSLYPFTETPLIHNLVSRAGQVVTEAESNRPTILWLVNLLIASWRLASLNGCREDLGIT